MFGKLSLEAVPYHNPIIMGAVGGSMLLALVILALITYYRKWTYLWEEWLTSVDHKKIGIMYIVLALVLLLRGVLRCRHDAISAGHCGGRVSGVPAAGSLQPGIQRPRYDHDHLRGHAVCGRVDEHRHPSPDRRPGCGVSLSEFGQPVADGGRCPPGHGVAGGWANFPKPAGPGTRP